MTRAKEVPPDISTKNIGVQVDIESNENEGKSILASKWLLWFLSVFVAAVAILSTPNFAKRYLGHNFHSEIPSELIDDIGLEKIIVFKQHDRDGDGYLSIEEFEPLAHRLENTINETVFEYDEEISLDDDIVTVETYFVPLDISTMTKEANEFNMGSDSLKGLKEWTTPVKTWKNFGAETFRSFMPPSDYYIQNLGKTYWLIDQMSGEFKGKSLSSNRYFPPKLVTDAEISIHRILSVFHKHPFVYSRFAPQGSVACVRAANDKFIDIEFRIHAEFQLNDPPLYPFWFTPAQFAGHLIMTRDTRKVLQFHIYVPNDKRLNVDMEWLNGPRDADNMEVDIGYMAQMEARSTRDSIPVVVDDKLGTDNRETRIESDNKYEGLIGSIGWDKELSQYQARRQLEVQLYPFKEVEYFNFTDAYSKAQHENKPVHSILLWGALDDQSC